MKYGITGSSWAKLGGDIDPTKYPPMMLVVTCRHSSCEFVKDFNICSCDFVMVSGQLSPYAEAVAEYLQLLAQKIQLQDMVDYARFAPSQCEGSVEQELKETRCAMASMRESWKKHGHNVTLPPKSEGLMGKKTYPGCIVDKTQVTQSAIWAIVG